MENTEQLKHIEQVALPPSENASKSVNGGVTRHMPTLRREVAAQDLTELWQELKLEQGPLIFASPMQRRVQLEHHPLLLDQLVANGKQRKKPLFGQLKKWEQLSAPEYAHGIAATGEVGLLLKADMLRQADIGERGTVPAAPYGWVCYTLGSDCQVLSFYFFDSDNSDSLTLTAGPYRHQDEWLAFLTPLDDLYDTIWRRTHRDAIEIISRTDQLAEVFK